MSTPAKTLGVIDGNVVLPYVLLGGLWLLLLWRVARGLRTGRLTAFHRESSFERRPRFDHHSRDREPLQFWLLFGFYVLALVLIPVMIWAGLSRGE